MSDASTARDHPEAGQPAPITKTRERIATAIERLIALLDEIDGDPDIEATALERRGCGFIPIGHDDDENTEDTLDWAEQGEPEDWF